MDQTTTTTKSSNAMSMSSSFSPPTFQSLCLAELTTALSTTSTANIRRDHLERLLVQYETELQTIEADISTTLDAQVTAIGDAARFLTDTEAELGHLTRLHESIKIRGETVTKTFPQFDELKQAHAARTNLATVMDQLDLYAKIPSKARKLIEELEQDSTVTSVMALRSASREWLGLMSWRDRVLGYVERLANLAKERQERLDRLERGEALVSPKSSNSLANLTTDQQLLRPRETYEVMLATLKNHFRDVFVVGDLICERVFDAANKVFTNANDNPALLVCAAEIVERHDAQLKREMKKRVVGGHHTASNSNNNNAEFELKRMRLEFLKRINKVADERAAACQSKHANNFDDAVTTVSQDLAIVAERIVPCFPPSYKIMSIFRKWYEARLFSLFSKAADANTSVLELVACAHRYNLLFLTSSPTALPATWSNMYDAQLPCVAFHRLSETLLDRVLQEMLVNVHQKQDRAKRRALITTTFDKLVSANVGTLNVLKFLIKVLQDKASGIAAMVEQAKTTKFVPSNVREACTEMADALESKTFLDQLMLKCFENLVVESDDVAGLIQQATDGVEAACREYETILERLRHEMVDICVMQFIKSDVFPFLFTPEWEGASYPSIMIICEQLGTALGDVSNALGENERNKIAELIFVSLMGGYVMTLVTRQGLRFQSIAITAERFKSDFLELQDFFHDKVDQCERKLAFWSSWVDVVEGKDAIDVELLTTAFGVKGARQVIKSLKSATSGKPVVPITHQHQPSEDEPPVDEDEIIRKRKSWFDIGVSNKQR